jgi:hypothetical protein
MTRFIAILSISFCLLGCSAKSSLRIDNLVFGNKRTGLQAEAPVFKPGETVYLGYAIRGVAKDGSGNAKLSYKVSFVDENDALVEVKGVEFKVNSELTAYGLQKPDPMKIPSSPSGPRILRFEVFDEISGERLIQEYPFAVEGSGNADIDPRDESHLAFCRSNLKIIDLALEMYWSDHDYKYYPESLPDLVPDYLKVVPECLAAGEDTYTRSYQSNAAEILQGLQQTGQTEIKPTFSVHCSGEHHKKAGVGQNRPALDSENGLE